MDSVYVVDGVVLARQLRLDDQRSGGSEPFVNRMERAANVACSWIPGYSTYSGLAGDRLARSMAGAERSGIVVEARYPTTNYGQQVTLDWMSFHVRVGPTLVAFGRWGRRRRPQFVELGAGTYDVSVVGLVGLEQSVIVESASVSVVSVFPELTGRSYGKSRVLRVGAPLRRRT